MMTLVLAIVALCLLAAGAASWPVLRGAHAAPDAGDGDAAALRAALDENEADRAAGRIGPSEAVAVRAELGRRLIALERGRSNQSSANAEQSAGRSLPLAAALAAPLGAVALYAWLGSPVIEPPRDRTAELDGPALVARAEAALAERPDDAHGWLAIAPAYRSLGRIEDAEAAFRRAAEGLEGLERSAALTGLADVVSSRAGGVTEEAQRYAAEALAIDPANDSAAFLLALHADRTRPPAEALPVWRDLIARFRPAAPPWLAAAEARVAALEGAARNPALSEAGRAIAEAAPEDRRRMIEGMVEGLAARLEQAPDDPEGWVRLALSNRVLGRAEQAEAAIERARAALEGASLSRFEALLAAGASSAAGASNAPGAATRASTGTGGEG